MTSESSKFEGFSKMWELPRNYSRVQGSGVLNVRIDQKLKDYRERTIQVPELIHSPLRVNRHVAIQRPQEYKAEHP